MARGLPQSLRAVRHVPRYPSPSPSPSQHVAPLLKGTASSCRAQPAPPCSERLAWPALPRLPWPKHGPCKALPWEVADGQLLHTQDLVDGPGCLPARACAAARWGGKLRFPDDPTLFRCAPPHPLAPKAATTRRRLRLMVAAFSTHTDKNRRPGAVYTHPLLSITKNVSTRASSARLLLPSASPPARAVMVILVSPSGIEAERTEPVQVLMLRASAALHTSPEQSHADGARRAVDFSRYRLRILSPRSDEKLTPVCARKSRRAGPGRACLEGSARDRPRAVPRAAPLEATNSCSEGGRAAPLRVAPHGHRRPATHRHRRGRLAWTGLGSWP